MRRGKGKEKEKRSEIEAREVDDKGGENIDRKAER